MNEPMLHLSLVQWLLLFGITLLVIEVAFLGFATFILFFIGSAMVIVAALMSDESYFNILVLWAFLYVF